MFLSLLPAVGAAVASAWAAALVAMPRKPLPHNEVQELVYSRLLGRQHRVILLACAITALGLLALVLSLPSGLAARASSTPSTQPVCFSESVSSSICYTPLPGGAWREESLQADRTWRVVGISYAVPHPPGEKDANP